MALQMLRSSTKRYWRKMIKYTIIALIYMLAGYLLRMIVANYTSKNRKLERAMAECDKARTKFFRDGGGEARKEWLRACENERNM